MSIISLQFCCFLTNHSEMRSPCATPQRAARSTRAALEWTNLGQSRDWCTVFFSPWGDCLSGRIRSFKKQTAGALGLALTVKADKQLLLKCCILSWPFQSSKGRGSLQVLKGLASQARVVPLQFSVLKSTQWPDCSFYCSLISLIKLIIVCVLLFFCLFFGEKEWFPPQLQLKSYLRTSLIRCLFLLRLAFLYFFYFCVHADCLTTDTQSKTAGKFSSIFFLLASSLLLSVSLLLLWTWAFCDRVPCVGGRQLIRYQPFFVLLLMWNNSLPFLEAT